MKPWKYPGVICDDCGKRPCTCRALNWSWAGYPMQLQRKWHAQYEARVGRVEVTEEAELQARKLYDKGWRQVSRRYRRISDGKFALELDRRGEPIMRALREIAYRGAVQSSEGDQ